MAARVGAGETAAVAATYLPSGDIERIAAGDRGRFFPETPGQTVLSVTVVAVDRDASRILPEPLLAAPHGGTLLVRQLEGALIPDQPIYKVRLKVTASGTEQQPVGERRGSVVIHAQAQSLLGPFLRNAASLVVRELSF